MIALNLVYGLWYEYCLLAIFIFALLSWFVLGSSLGFYFDLLLRSQSKKQLLSSATKPKMKSFIPSKKSLFRLLKLVLTLGSGAVINNTVNSARLVTSPQAAGQIVSTASMSFVAHNHLVSQPSNVTAATHASNVTAAPSNVTVVTPAVSPIAEQVAPLQYYDTKNGERLFSNEELRDMQNYTNQELVANMTDADLQFFVESIAESFNCDETHKLGLTIQQEIRLNELCNKAMNYNALDYNGGVGKREIAQRMEDERRDIRRREYFSNPPNSTTVARSNFDNLPTSAKLLMARITNCEGLAPLDLRQDQFDELKELCEEYRWYRDVVDGGLVDENVQVAKVNSSVVNHSSYVDKPFLANNDPSQFARNEEIVMNVGLGEDDGLAASDDGVDDAIDFPNDAGAEDYEDEQPWEDEAFGINTTTLGHSASNRVSFEQNDLAQGQQGDDVSCLLLSCCVYVVVGRLYLILSTFYTHRQTWMLRIQR